MAAGPFAGKADDDGMTGFTDISAFSDRSRPPDCWTWELPDGYVDSDEDPAVTAAHEAARVEWADPQGWLAGGLYSLRPTAA